uniref:Uncharacterized protein n=1 Tax=Oryza glumipatula TaxID=40148 RepID=A0A0E0B1B7_9ORYZ
MSAPGQLALNAVPSWMALRVDRPTCQFSAPPDSALRWHSSAPVGLALTFESFRPTRAGRESDGDGAFPLQALILLDLLGNQEDWEGISGGGCGVR